MDLSTLPIDTMETAITDRLRLAFPVRDFTIERVPQVLTIKEFERLSKLSPFIGLAWMAFLPDGTTNARQTKGDMTWRLILINKASSTLETRFKGDKRGIGLDAMVQVSVLLLNGTTFDGIGASQVTRAAAAIADGWSDDAIAIAQVDFKIAFAASPSRLQLVSREDFERLGITWIMEPRDEDAPPVTETVTIPQGA